MNNASTTSFKDELEAEIRSADSSHRKKLLVKIVASFLLATSCIIGALLLIPAPAAEQAIESLPAPSSNSSEVTNQENPAIADTAPQVETKTGNDNATSSTPYTPPAPSQIDKGVFKAQSRQLLTHYSSIVELVNFPTGMSTSDKVARIKQAYSLDKQYFSQTIELRAMVNSASSPPSEYMTAVGYAENGVSAISVGVDGLNQWAENPNGISSIDASLGSVEKGAASLQQLSQVLSGL